MDMRHRPPDLRAARFTDVPRLAELDRVCFPKYAFSPDLILRFLELGLPCVVAEDGATGDVAGFAMVMPELDEGTGVLITLDVAPDRRRVGLGRTMVAWCARALLEHDPPIGTMWLTVASRNVDARTFYGAMGFREVDTIEGYYRDDDAVVMVHIDMSRLAAKGPG